MKKDLKSEIKNYTRKALRFIEGRLEDNEFNFDHISYQTTSKEDYHTAIDEFKEFGNLINEIPHAGRRLGIIQLTDPISIKNIEIDRIEISEPKPKSSIKRRNIDHCSFYLTNDYESEIQKLKDQGVKIIDQKQIENDKFSKIIHEDIEVELRNNQLGGDRDKTQTEGKINETEKIDKLKKEIEIHKEKRLQALADYQNLQKRVQKEQSKTRTLATVDILKDVIEICEDFERLIEESEISEYTEGMKLIKNKLEDILEKNNIVKLETEVGDKFDEDIHEAIGVRKIDDKKKVNTIIQIVQKGYKIKDSNIIVKPLLVLVGKK